MNNSVIQHNARLIHNFLRKQLPVSSARAMILELLESDAHEDSNKPN